ncbi:uncharacterized protein PGTG_06067 [Puccinia graminis f. sp. tritici CRL 75-36-700-3]|uniref:Integrase core domain-containing protein n=1 Tax=Puccinia graminis f. sp. tritici (strain CRL 75-36-700-3 / race SCCL) TaxID=418459 RepID=E3K5F0_PUCGT|nr:uncharacterized protein PGTG_06067 [Puccinia graminis f. sp. tritici CRL 75-36-700-3]EFP79746.1 hypothetical protein PGTG_06067 [Puccinia graminis f. sp. tritici CRL 75-36-700-3]
MRASMRAFGDNFQPEVTDLLSTGWTDSQIREHIKAKYDISVSQRTLTRRKEDWGLILQAADHAAQIEDHIHTYFERGLTYSQIHHALSTSHGYVQSKRTLERKIKLMDLTRRTDDLDNEKIDIDTVVSCIEEIHQTPEGRNAGYRKMRQLLQTKYGLHIHTLTVAMINRTLDPDGVQNRAKRVLKRRVFKTPGPNFIWSADGHDKLKKFGITIYGFIDAWSRKILGLFVHVTNNDPRHIGYYYLQLVKREGGIPRRTTTDKGTETIQMAGHQINLTEEFNHECPDPSQSHLFTKSTHNQKIECLWSQMMKQYNCELINHLFEAIEKDCYDPNDPVEYLLFIYLWVPLLQQGLDDWTNNYNNYKRRWDPKSMLPTRCSAEWCYKYPAEVGGEQGLICVPQNAVEALEEEFYPEAAEMMDTSPKWFSESIKELQVGMDLTIPPVDIHNVWDTFSLLLQSIRDYDSAWLDDPSNEPSQTFASRAS